MRKNVTLRSDVMPVTGCSRSAGAPSSIVVPTLERRPLTRYGVEVVVRELRGLVVHYFRTVACEFDHLGVVHALDGMRAGDPPRIGGHHAAHVGVDLDAFGRQRVAQRDRGQVAAATAERGDRAVLRERLETRSRPE